MQMLFRSWNQIDVCGRPQAHCVFFSLEFRPEGASHFVLSCFEIHGPSAVQLVVAVHRPAVLKPNQHGFGHAGHINNGLAFDEVFSSDEGGIRE